MAIKPQEKLLSQLHSGTSQGQGNQRVRWPELGKGGKSEIEKKWELSLRTSRAKKCKWKPHLDFTPDLDSSVHLPYYNIGGGSSNLTTVSTTSHEKTHGMGRQLHRTSSFACDCWKATGSIPGGHGSAPTTAMAGDTWE